MATIRKILSLFTRLFIITIKSFETFKLDLYRLSLKGREPSKNRRMPQFAASTRYSLVKGEKPLDYQENKWH
jgi:hypothetical protein